MKNFGRMYQRNLRGKSRFVWCENTVGIIIRGNLQFHRSPGQKKSIHQSAPHLRSLICEYVKNSVCSFNGNSGWAEDHYERIHDRWIRTPSLRAVVLKLQTCSRFVDIMVHGLTKPSYDEMRKSGIMIPRMVYSVFNEMAHERRYHALECGSLCPFMSLPAIPQLTFEPVYGYCYTCGIGISDSVDFNFIPRHCCMGLFDLKKVCGEDVCLCSGCIAEYVDD